MTTEMGLTLGGRRPARILSAVFEWRHYRALLNSFGTYLHPLDGLARYTFGGGAYPCNFALRTPNGVISPRLYTRHDMLTVNEIFCRKDYDCGDAKVIVDFGSNIGISGLFFLTQSKDAFAYLFEPLPQNVERLKDNLRSFEGRFSLDPVAVGLEPGEVSFGWEPTGRYGGIGIETGSLITVKCRRANDVLAEIIDKHGRIDVLKIDIESLEQEIIAAIPHAMKKKIRNIFVEQRYKSNPYEGVYSLEQYGGVARFHLMSPARN